MSSRMERLRTPSPTLDLANGQLLSPPLTGGLGKRARFAEDPDTPTSKRFARSQKLEECALAGYTDIKESSDEIQDLSDGDASSEKSSSPSPLTSSTSHTDQDFAEDAFAVSAPVTDNLAVTEPFAFMKLPLPVRNRVYDFLCVVPALICVRQNHIVYHAERQAYLHAEHRELLPGIAYALAQLTVDGYKFRFARFRSTNVNILQASKKVHAEAKAVMYSANDFEILRPSLEFSPPPNFKIPLFPRGYQGLVRKLNIRIRAFYPLQWLLNGGHADLKDAYRDLDSLTLIFEMEVAQKGFGKRACRIEGEAWVPYVQRLRNLLAVELYGQVEVDKNMPIWINFRVLFDGDRYDDAAELHHGGLATIAAGSATASSERAKEDASRLGMKRGLAEAFELFKR